MSDFEFPKFEDLPSQVDLDRAQQANVETGNKWGRPAIPRSQAFCQLRSPSILTDWRMLDTISQGLAQ